MAGHGLVLGKFMPPHRGHQYLIDFARQFTPDLTVVVGTLKNEPIAGDLRFTWMKELFPQARVVHLQDENPQYPHEHPDFWAIWRESLQRVAQRPVNWLFASEEYGARLAQELGASFVPTNGGRQLLEVSGTQIREHPMQHWDYLTPPVRLHYLRRVSVFGPESTGKSTLSESLAQHFGTIHAPEFARTWLEPREGQVELADMELIARGQAASEDALAHQARRLLICDTDPLATQLWCQELFQQCPDAVKAIGASRSYHLTLLTDVDVPWVADSVRYRPEQRGEFLAACQQLLNQHGRAYLKLSGSWEQRKLQAVQAINELLSQP